MSEPSRSERPSSSRRRSSVSSSRHEASSSRRASAVGSSSSRPSRHDPPSTSKRRTHSTTALDEGEMDEETRARLARREERRRKREKEKSEEEGRSVRRSTSLTQPPPSPRPFGGGAPSRAASLQPQPTTKPAYFSNVDFTAKSESEEKAFDEEAADRVESLSAKKAAYLRAVEKREQRTSKRRSGDDDIGESAEHRRSSIDSPPSKPAAAKKPDDEVQSPVEATHGKSSRHRSSRRHTEPAVEKKERKSSRRSSVATTVDQGKIEKRSSGDADLSKSSSSGDKARKRDKRRSNESGHSSKEKKRSSRKDDETRSHRSSRKHSSRHKDDESGRSKEKRRSKDDRSERHRSSRRSAELSDRPPKDKSRARSTDRLAPASAQQREEFLKRRDERLTKEEGETKEETKDEEYRRRREERQAKREERLRLSGDPAQSAGTRMRSVSVPKYSSDLRSREGDPRRTISGGTSEASADATRKSIFGTKPTREKADADGGLFGSNDAEAARKRLHERMAAREKAKDASMSDSEAQSVSSRRSREMGVGDSALVSTRPKLVDVRRRGIASVLKQQRTNTVESGENMSSSSSSSSESESEEESMSAEDIESDEESSVGDDEEMWTVRVSLISAVDLPLHIVPNMPLCPVLKFGIISLPAHESDAEEAPNDEATKSQNSVEQKSSTLSQIQSTGLTSLAKARVRCTSNKILSKRDNGAVEFHEEMRWDNVKRPMHAALVVELSAKASLPPTNLKESPLITQSTKGSGASVPQPSPSPPNESTSGPQRKPGGESSQRPDMKRSQSGDSTGGQGASESESSIAATSVPSISRSGSTDDDDATPMVHGAGLTGMRALWKRGRQQFEQRQVARLNEPTESDPLKASNPTADGVANGGDEGQPSLGQGFMSRKIAPDRNVPSIADENFTLLRPRKRRKLQMAEDLRLGSLVIPLTRLPLENAIKNKEVARIEQWYQLEAYNVLVPSQTTPTWRGKGTTKPLPRRSPTVQLEISFSPPEVVDDSEDDMDDVSLADLVVLNGDGTDEEAKKADLPTHKRPSLTDGANAGTAKSFARRAAGRSFSRRVASEMRTQEKIQEEQQAVAQSSTSPPVKKVPEDPVLEPGLVDFVCVVGVSNIGDQKDDDGGRGWVNTSPECNLLEQFPPNDEFHIENGRNVALANKVEWFCFPGGWKLWRGEGPPSPADLNIQRYSTSTGANTLQSNAAFDACLGCTTSFSWFVIASNSDEYGSRNVKTYGAVIKFYVPAPKGIDQTQDDYAQTMAGGPVKPQPEKKNSTAKRLWVPMGICLTSNLPIVGVMESMLLRICETLASTDSLSSQQKILPVIQKDIANLIVNFQKPISGVLHCSVPFLQGERLHVTLPPPTGLPPLPHGSSVSGVCRLLGAEGLNLMLSALLTECKIIIHSDEISNLPMVSEVMTALLYPFIWALPCIPVLPDAMVEFVEAPLSYLLGIPTSSVKLIDPAVLEDVVVVDLDSDFGSSDYFDGRRTGKSTKAPTPLPSSVATKISKAVFRLLREEGEVAEEYGASTFPGSRSLPRLESESLAEREFRIAVALQVCGLLRGYDDCLFKVSASQPVFNRDKFLKTAPALFETQRGNLPIGGPGNGRGATPRTLSPRSKRFLSILVNCQHFHQFLHALEEDECAFFNEVMYTFEMNDEQEDDRMLGGYGTSPTDDAAAHLTKALQKVEDKIPTYRVERKGKKQERRASGGWDDDDEFGIVNQGGPREKGREKQISDDSFPRNLLQPVSQSRPSNGGDGASGDSESSEGVHTLSVQYLMELEKGNWRYEKLFQIPLGAAEGEESAEPSIVQVREKVRLREAIGERRYRTWKLTQEQKLLPDDSSTRLTSGDMLSADANPALDLTSLLSSMVDDATSETSSVTQSSLSISTQTSTRASTLSPEQQRLADAKDRDVLRRCLERAYEGSQKRPSRTNRRSSDEEKTDTFIENGRDLVAEAETALRNPSAQRFLVSVLSQRSRLENQKKRRSMIEDPKGGRRQTTQSVSRLESASFECLVRLCCAMLDSCMESKDYEPAYGLLTHTAGFCTVQTKDGRGVDSRSDEASQDPSNKVVYMTARIGLHPIFADLRLWEEVLRLHLKDRENEKNPEAGPALIGKANSNLVEYEAAVATLYEMLGFGIPAEELARFATRVSEDHGWFDTERGHSLLMLARRLGVRREQEGEEASGGLDLMRTGGTSNGGQSRSDTTGLGVTPVKGSTTPGESGELQWSEIGWCHPAAPSTVRVQYVQTEGDERGGSSSKRLKRSAVTSIASFGSSVVASGGLDGSVFVAHTIQFEDDQDDTEESPKDIVHGIHLDWGSSGSRTAAVASSLSSMDGEYGVGAVSCLAAAKGAGYRNAALSASSSRSKDVREKADEEEFLSAMEGCRVVAGTTAGDLRVWTVKDVYAATVLAKKGSEKESAKSRVAHGGSGATSSFVSKTRGRGITDIAAGSAFSRLQFSLRGRALSGHRGGVSSMDVPSHLYRPDSLVTGGADGFIKLWSLRQPMAGRRASGETLPGAKSSMFNTSIAGVSPADQVAQGRPTRSGDALSILSGHSGRVLCVKTAWHGDRLLSGGADRTVRIWDLAGSGGKCLNTLTGHLGWVTHAHYWGPNTIVTGSTDRSIALWDPRVRKSPLFILRYHYSPVSDLLVGSRTDPLMISAGGDGTIATWDFRTLSGSNAKETVPADETSSDKKAAETNEKHVTAFRTPVATMKHAAEGKRVRQSAAVMLSRGVTQPNTVLSTGVDAVVREWEISSGKLVGLDETKHCEGVSGFITFSDAQSSLGASAAESGGDGSSKHGGIITSSWDGTVRMRKFVRK